MAPVDWRSQSPILKGFVTPTAPVSKQPSSNPPDLLTQREIHQHPFTSNFSEANQHRSRTSPMRSHSLSGTSTGRSASIDGQSYDTAPVMNRASRLPLAPTAKTVSDDGTDFSPRRPVSETTRSVHQKLQTPAGIYRTSSMDNHPPGPFSQTSPCLGSVSSTFSPTIPPGGFPRSPSPTFATSLRPGSPISSHASPTNPSPTIPAPSSPASLLLKPLKNSLPNSSVPLSGTKSGVDSDKIAPFELLRAIYQSPGSRATPPSTAKDRQDQLQAIIDNYFKPSTRSDATRDLLMFAVSENARLQSESSKVPASTTDSDTRTSINPDTPGTTPLIGSPAQQITQRGEELIRYLHDKNFMGNVVTSFSTEEYAGYVGPIFRELC